MKKKIREVIVVEGPSLEKIQFWFKRIVLLIT